MAEREGLLQGLINTTQDPCNLVAELPLLFDADAAFFCAYTSCTL